MLSNRIIQAASNIGGGIGGNDEDTVFLADFIGDTGHEVTVNGTPIIVDEKPIAYGGREDPNSAFGNSAYFPGDGYFIVPDSSDWDIVGSSDQDYTISFWIKHNDLTGTQYVLSHYEDVNNRLQITSEPGFGLRLAVVSGGSVILDTGYSGEITDLYWHHVAFVKKTSSGPTVEYGVYKDGVQTDYISDSSIDTFSGSLYIGVAGSLSGYFKGYLDDFIIEASNDIFNASPNVGLTDTITVPTSEYTSTTDTKLLLHFSDMEQGETPATVTDSGNTGHTVTNVSSKVSGCGYYWNGSMKFENSVDYLSIPDGTSWDLGTGDYTIEAWFKSTDSVNSGIISSATSGPDTGWALTSNAGKMYWFVPGVIGWGSMVSTSDVDTGAWIHVKVVRNGSGSNNVKMYINGTEEDSYSDSGGATNGTAALAIGGDYAGIPNFAGNISDLRLSTTARSSSVPTKPLVSDSDTVLLLPLSGNIGVGSSESHDITIANTGLVMSTEAPTGFSGSWEFNGTDDYVSIADSDDLDFEGDDFTIDMFVKFDALTSSCFLSQLQNADNQIFWYYQPSSSIGLYAHVFSGSGTPLFTLSQGSTSGWAVDTWYHIAFIRNGSSFKLYRAGTSIASTTYAGDMPNISADAWIGAYQSGPNHFLNGNICNYRISKGIARWTSTFTPPTGPYTKE